MKGYEKTYEEFWKDIVEVRGELDMDQVKKELHDFRILLKQIPEVYNEISGLSNPFTNPVYILSQIEQRMIDRKTAFEDLTLISDNGEVTLSVEYLREYFRVEEES